VSDEAGASRARDGIGLREATAVWAHIGVNTFGGPAGQIAVMHRELVERRRWVSEQRFLHALNYCMLLPGPEAQQLATYIGWLMNGVPGGVIAGSLFVIPGFVAMLALAVTYALYGTVTWSLACCSGSPQPSSPLSPKR
jgi:chromate transporter